MCERFWTLPEGTSYDSILTEWSIPENDEEDSMRLAKAMEIQRSDIEGKKVLVAGVGGGTELDMVLSFEPRIVYALDFSSFVVSHAKSEKYKNKQVQFLIGDICNLPFRPGIFDYIVSSGIIHHARSPELAHRSLWPTLKPGGYLNYGHIYLENIHNARVSLDRLRKQYHDMNAKEAQHRLARYAKIYTFLINSGLLRFMNRTRVRVPFILELSGKKGEDFQFHYDTATDYYMCRYRHMIPRDDVFDWFEKVGCKATRTPKGFLGMKA